MVKVGDRLSLAILGLCCGGTFIALALTSISKKAGQLGPPPKPDFPWLKPNDASFEERLKAMDTAAPTTAQGSSSSSSGGSKAAS